MRLFTEEYFRGVYPSKELEFNVIGTVSRLLGIYICTLGTAYYSSKYDNENYMTKAYICLLTTMVSIFCCAVIYLTQTYFWVSVSGLSIEYLFSNGQGEPAIGGLLIEYLLSTGWGQPAISMLIHVCESTIRGAAIAVFFFWISIFSVIADIFFKALHNHYGFDAN